MQISEIKAEIADACRKAGRNPDAISLVAVGKSQPAQKIEALLQQGVRIFGENRVQEAEEKFPRLRENYPGIELHFIGHLQTNKARDAVKTFDVIETVDSARLASELRREMDRQKRELPCFIQVNTGGEEQKGGVSPRDLAALHRFCTQEARLNIEGLMCIPPAHEIPDLHFALLKKLADGLGLKKLSMGMSADFKAAIFYGATHIRVGSAIFGVRER